MGSNRPNNYNQNPRNDNSLLKEEVDYIKSLKNFSSFDIDKFVKYADNIGKHLQENQLKTSQIRKFLSAVVAINSKSHSTFNRIDVVLLKPKLAYAVGRNRDNNGIRSLFEVLDNSIDKIQEFEDFQQLAKFVESIVAYHKFYGGRD